jgi:hypothetical protein
MFHKPLNDYLNEPPGSCRSKNLWGSVTFAKYVLEKLPPSDTPIDLYQDVAVWYLEAAAAAAKRGCPAAAKEIYTSVIETFIGSAYDAYRQRAEIGLDDLRGQRQ